MEKQRVVYLAGPIAGMTDLEASGWRYRAAARLEEVGFRVLNPMIRDYRGKEYEPSLAKRIVEDDKNEIAQSDFLLVNASVKHSQYWGTAQEVLLAFMAGKKIVAFTGGNFVSPWLAVHVTKIVETFDEAIVWLTIQILGET